MFHSIGDKSPNWNGWKLVLPAVSIGNVGQLAMDLVITTLSMKKVGYLHHESLQALCGNDALNSNSGITEGNLTIGTEVFEQADKRLVCVQQRVLFVKGKQAAFRRDLLEWIKTCGFTSVTVLTSSASHERIDCQLTGNPFRYLTTPSFDKLLGDSFEKTFDWTRLERRKDNWSGNHGNQSDITDEASGVFIPGGGLAAKLFRECCERDVALAVLLVFCSEGDNIPDALNLVQYLNQWLKLAEENSAGNAKGGPWKYPASWSLLFGREVDPTLY
ncbi:proteasome assembly chaperone 2-like [Apostichopus japonicus]|uniref:proteasome assembly chaperone 2-like n=1 Tax=Stichopus japonicus TaxID=307972 RepID=UPI003AB73240